MTTLAALLSILVTSLQESDLCRTVRVKETHTFSAHQFSLKVRTDLVSGDVLQIRIYCNNDHADYSYQLLRDNQPILRWDNKEHFPEIATFPHHFHSPTGEVQRSPLSGEPITDLQLVLRFLASYNTNPF